MKQIKFKEANMELKAPADMPECGTLPVFQERNEASGGRNVYISCGAGNASVSSDVAAFNSNSMISLQRSMQSLQI